ncbi:unnamed protein product [Meloidogyne enterolobii]|uniref:Uncharacterized protein n=1 Tax=Meloidogyne enterolobii TaxID=390850 RepID=A0ACB0ZVN0_MELEN
MHVIISFPRYICGEGDKYLSNTHSTSDYGKEEWKKDHHTSNFAWDKSNKNKESMEIYTEAEWPNVYLYVGNKNDRFDSKKVDEWIKNINKTL